MTRKSKREIEREVSDLSDRDGGDGTGILIASEHDDGTLTDLDGEPVPDGAFEDAGLVIKYPRESGRTDA